MYESISITFLEARFHVWTMLMLIILMNSTSCLESNLTPYPIMWSFTAMGFMSYHNHGMTAEVILPHHDPMMLDLVPIIVISTSRKKVDRIKLTTRRSALLETVLILDPLVTAWAMKKFQFVVTKATKFFIGHTVTGGSKINTGWRYKFELQHHCAGFVYYDGQDFAGESNTAFYIGSLLVKPGCSITAWDTAFYEGDFREYPGTLIDPNNKFGIYFSSPSTGAVFNNAQMV